ncbi:hypothetical protein BDK92_6249 [Micromonospora pisi]|uniref:Uncharacterized protein n=1 Tax=Micromonospora pisi TaxID=589240 RepID=A0A495JS65_9ACTN|nr:hypothetical protein [Micromonospora pisi]RKR91827.1 hypothetical protein BDK92_6249 [Micromonospora pisi]
MRVLARVTEVICSEVDAVLTLSLRDGLDRVVEFLFWYDFDAHEVINGDGVVVYGAVSSWRLTRRDLYLEYSARSAARLGFPRLHHLRLDLSDEQFAEVRAALVEIIGVECHVIED